MQQSLHQTKFQYGLKTLPAVYAALQYRLFYEKPVHRFWRKCWSWSGTQVIHHVRCLELLKMRLLRTGQVAPHE